MEDLATRMRRSQPSIIGFRDSVDALLYYFLNQDYVTFSSKLLGWTTTYHLANLYVSALASVEVSDDVALQSTQPIHVYNGVDETGQSIIGLTYSNGALFLIEVPGQDDIIVCIMNRELAKTYELDWVPIKVNQQQDDENDLGGA